MEATIIPLLYLLAGPVAVQLAAVAGLIRTLAGATPLELFVPQIQGNQLVCLIKSGHPDLRSWQHLGRDTW